MTHDMRAQDPQARLNDAVAATLEGRRLLTHPFYQRWEAGELGSQELAEYAVHYRAFEAVLPTVLSAVVDRLMFDGEFEAAEMVARNLADELGRPEPHLALFDRFADALPAADAPAPGPAADALADTYLALAEQSPVAAIAGLAAYETQAAAIAATKGDGLRRWYGVDADGTTFWDVHATMDVDHGDWAVEALALLGADEAEVTDASRRAADAWWALLDEREAEGMAAV
ncbi:MAG TPA: iron-containing redox enzyme family protein [Acidimicrobiales bacterium]